MSNPLYNDPQQSAQFSAASFQEIGFPWRLLLFSGFLFGFAVFVFLGLKFGYGIYLDGRSAALQKDIEGLAAQVGEREQQELVTFYSQLVNIESILKKHIFTFNTLPFLERTTVSSVYFSSANFSPNDFVLDLRGNAPTIDDVVGQLSVFDTAPEVAQATLRNVALNPGNIAFDVSLKLKGTYFEKLQ